MGASVFVIAKSRLLQLLPSDNVQPSQVFLRSYSGERKKVEGKADILVKFHGKEADIPIFLTGDNSPTLLGLNWMREPGIGLSNVAVNIRALSHIKHLVQDFAEVFEEGRGTYKGAKASLHVPSDAPPRFFKPRLLPYALTDGYTCLPFGVSSAPAISQREMENLLRGLPYVAVYFDDILVTGANDAEHFKNIRAVLRKLQESGLKVKLKVSFLRATSAVLAHKDADGREHPIAFASRSLSKAERNYSQLDREALALVFGVDRFHQHLWGIPFEAYTDHKLRVGLLGANKPVTVKASPRLVRWALKLSAYNCALVYKPGKELGPADALSRLSLPNDSTSIPAPAEIFMLEEAYPRLLSPAVVARATRNDPVLDHVVHSVLKGESLPAGPEWNPFSTRGSELSLHEGCLLWGHE
ncbi:uncharacterized protein LOC142570460 [Dermacentor variabilis]|uniref:uncharacterized protein LOC142570460 n=1 Tax=Dermacentor variabilis TaxID=34621 RepID=UPI003F5C926B